MARPTCCFGLPGIPDGGSAVADQDCVCVHEVIACPPLRQPEVSMAVRVTALPGGRVVRRRWGDASRRCLRQRTGDRHFGRKRGIHMTSLIHGSRNLVAVAAGDRGAGKLPRPDQVNLMCANSSCNRCGIAVHVLGGAGLIPPWQVVQFSGPPGFVWQVRHDTPTAPPA